MVITSARLWFQGANRRLDYPHLRHRGLCGLGIVKRGAQPADGALGLFGVVFGVEGDEASSIVAWPVQWPIAACAWLFSLCRQSVR